MSIDDGDDDVAITEGMEAEVSIDDHRAGKTRDGGGDDDDDEPAFTAGGEPLVRAGRHPVSEKTRELFKKASASVRKQLEEDGDESPFGEYDEGAAPSPKKTGLGTTTVVEVVKDAGKLEVAPQQPPVEPATSSQQSAEAQAYRAQLEARGVELAEREARIAEQERAGDLAQIRTTYFEKGAVAVRDMLKGWLGKDATEDDIRQEVADLITDLSVQVLGVEVPSEIRAKMDTKRALRSVKVLKDSISESEAQKAKQAEQEREVEGRRQAVQLLNQEIKNTSKDYAKQFPYLMAEDNPGELIYLTAVNQHKKDGTQLHWSEAAKRVNEHLRTQVSAFIDKRKHLISAAPATAGAPANGQRERPQGDPQGIRRSHTLTNAATGATTTTTPPVPDPPVQGGKWSREAHRANTRSKFRNAFTADPDE